MGRNLVIELKLKAFQKLKKLTCEFYLLTLRVSKVKFAKDHGKKLRSELAPSLQMLFIKNNCYFK